MKIIFKSALLVLSSFAFLSCNGEKEVSNESSTPSESGAKPYPLETCLVSGKKLGSMGDPYVIVHEGQEIKFCCDGCEPTFKKDPAKFLTKLENQ
jgi:YHS domain-containing protein